MGTPSETALTDRQIEVLELRERGLTQSAVAEQLGTTDSNVSAIERAAESNIKKARATLQLIHVIRSSVQFDVPCGNSIDTIVDAVYDHGDDANIRITYRKPELYGQMFHELESFLDDGQLGCRVLIGITTDGHITVFARND